MGWRVGIPWIAEGCRPLSQPYVLWDTRQWNGVTGLGTAGLPNLGSGGSAFDLDVYSVAYTYSGSPGTATYASQGSGTWRPPTSAIDWANIGGHPCAGAFTAIIAYGAFPGYPDYCEADILFSTTSGSGGQFGVAQAIGYYKPGAPANAADGNCFINTFTGSEYALWNAPQTEVLNNADIYLKNQMITVTHDSVLGNLTAYRGLTQVTNSISGTNEEVDGFASVDGCSAFAQPGDLTNDYHFFYCGEDRRLGASNPPPVGEPWTGIVGMALFRGCPSTASLTYWYNYFYG